jgi:hypothetical protein
MKKDEEERSECRKIGGKRSNLGKVVHSFFSFTTSSHDQCPDIITSEFVRTRGDRRICMNNICGQKTSSATAGSAINIARGWDLSDKSAWLSLFLCAASTSWFKNRCPVNKVDRKNLSKTWFALAINTIHKTRFYGISLFAVYAVH